MCVQENQLTFVAVLVRTLYKYIKWGILGAIVTNEEYQTKGESENKTLGGLNPRATVIVQNLIIQMGFVKKFSWKHGEREAKSCSD